MKYKLIAYAGLPVLAAGLLGANFASAHGFGMGMFGMGGASLTPDQIA